MTLKETFEQAVEDSQKLPKKPDTMTMLRMYSLYKQAIKGDADPEFKPGMFDFVAKAKHDAWMELRGISPDDAMQQYIDMYNKLKG